MLRGDKIYAYEPGMLQRRYEGIVHKVQLLDVKLGFDMKQYVVYFSLCGSAVIVLREPRKVWFSQMS